MMLDENFPYGMVSRSQQHNQISMQFLYAAYKAGDTTLADKISRNLRKDMEQQEAYYAGITTRAEALTALEAGTQKLYAAIDGVAADRWGEVVETFFGPRTLLATASIASMHMMYHDGQLNSLHLRHGDAEMHWK